MKHLLLRILVAALLSLTAPVVLAIDQGTPINLRSDPSHIPATTAQKRPASQASENNVINWLWRTVMMALFVHTPAWASLFLYLVFQVLAIRRMQGGWRVLAKLPLAVMALIVAWIVLAIWDNSTQGVVLSVLLGFHMITPFLIVYFVVLLLLHALSKWMGGFLGPRDF